jgi:hypothetical protein
MVMVSSIQQTLHRFSPPLLSSGSSQ